MSHRWFTRRFSFILAGAVAITAVTASWAPDALADPCPEQGQVSQVTAGTVVSEPRAVELSDAIPGAMPGDVPSATQAEEPGGADQAMSNLEIADILSVANRAESEQSYLALWRAEEPAVREFAARMIVEHTSAEVQVRGLLAAMGMTLERTERSEQLRQETAALLGELAQLEGAEFDQAYMDTQIMMHQGLLELIDTQLIPEAEGPALELWLPIARAQIASHLDAAERIQETLAEPPADEPIGD